VTAGTTTVLKEEQARKEVPTALRCLARQRKLRRQSLLQSQ